MKTFLNNIETQRLITAIKLLKTQKYVRSISEICDTCGVNRSYLRDIETKNTSFSKVFLEKLFATYPINEDYILTGNGEILLLEEKKSPIWGEINNIHGGVVQNIANNGNGNVEATATKDPTFVEVLQQLVATNAKLVETNAKLVEMLNVK